jgi:zinc protease
MKTIQKKGLISIGLLIIALLFCNSFLLKSQDLPIDPQVRIGKLPNGMTYYVRKNVKPEKRVELRLAVNSGSVQEDNDQLGLAHFVEHMCFNGTKNFPKNDLVHYLQSAGVGFGPELNGYTSFDETVYILRVPTDSAEVLNKGIQIMRDWANDVTFDTTEIDKERGVLVEEWRLGLGAWDRMSKKFLPVLFKGSKYADRLPIGTKEIIEGAKYSTITRFYKDWYRPDLMAFIVVGDIDVDKIEQKIKHDFGEIKEPESPRLKEKNPVPDNEQTLKVVVSDKENSCNSINLIYKTDIESFKTITEYRKYLLYQMFAGMLSTRLNELNLSSNPPFINSWVYYGNIWTRGRSGLQFDLQVSENGIEKALEVALTENERVKRYGFTLAELDRYKKTMLKNLETQYKEREKTESDNLVWKYVNNFLQDSPIPGPEFEYNYAKNNLGGIKLDELNAIAKKWINDRNRLIIVMGIDKPMVKLPSENDLQTISNKVDNSKIEPYKDVAIATSLIPEKPKPGKVTSRKPREAGITELDFANGVKVVLKPTTFKNDEILISAFCPGGQSVFSDSYQLSAECATEIMQLKGLGGFSKIELNKFLSGKNVKVDPYIDQYFSGINGNCSVSDFETMLQLTHLYFTDKTKDIDAYNSCLERKKAFFKNFLTDPVNYFFDEARKIRYNRHPRIANTCPSDSALATVNPDKVYEVCQKSFENANGFVFALVGSFNTDSIIPLLETYIGSLPFSKETHNYRDLGISPIDAPQDLKIYRGQDPRSFVCVFQDGPVSSFTKEESHVFWSLTNILQRIYMDKLREDMSGVYGFGVFADVVKDPLPSEHFELTIPCSPNNVDKLVSAALDVIKNIKANGVSAADLEKETETQIRGIEREAQENGSWLWRIERVYRLDEGYTRLTNPKAFVDLVTSQNLQQIAVKYLNTDKLVKIALYPEGYKK